VAPTFTFSHQQADAPIFDPRQDRSEMGALSEAVRTHRAAQRSHHLLHSVAAVGAQAALITAVHGPSAWAADGPFWQFYAVDAKIVLLGVPYLRCTFFHMIEQMVATPYRHWVEKSATLRNEQGVECPLPTLIFRGKAGFIGNDFNKLGALLEEQQLVQVGPVGNAVTRVFAARAALAVGLAAYRRDPQLFLKTGPDYHPLADGYMVGEQYREKTVYR
jgi:aminoglycoside 3-N-acetyltransferase